MIRMPMGLARMAERSNPRALASVLDRPFHLVRRRLRVHQREVRHRNKAAAALRAPVDDPAVVRAAHRLGDLGVLAFAFPAQPYSWIYDRGGQVLRLQPLDTFFRVHRPPRSDLAPLTMKIPLVFFAR